MPVEERVCIGLRETTKGDLAVFFVAPDGTEGGFKRSSHLSYAIRFARPGHVLSFTLDDDGRVKDARYARTEKSERVEQWAIKSEAAEAEFNARKLQAKADYTTIARMVEPIRDMYRSRIDPAQRRAILMCVMEAITR